MPERALDPWRVIPEPACGPVPQRYRGVWQRTLLQTSDMQDDSTSVRWLQLGRWHADLRVPRTARWGAAAPTGLHGPQLQARLMLQQGFAGITQVEEDAQGEVCTWHRLVDYQPPGHSPDAGRMIFETPERVIETGVHGAYREIWQRLPQSTGRCIALAEPERPDGQASARLFLAGCYLMRVRPRVSAGNPEFEISFGVLAAGQWRVEQSTRPELEGQSTGFSIRRQGMTLARVDAVWAGTSAWQVLEWEE